MERWGEKAAAAAAAPAHVRTRRFADQPSFSSTLLDAIYKSMDEPDAGGGVTATKKQSHDMHYSYYYKASLAGSYRDRDRDRARAPAHATTSSSSDGSSYGGFSSSEAESSQRRRLRPIRTSVAGGEPPAPAPAPDKRATTNKPAKKPAGANIRAKLRDLRNKPASPGARLAGFLNAIFNGRRAGGGGGGSAPQTPPSASAACSTASSSYSRSCLSKTPSTRGQPRRTVRFVDSDADAPAAAPPAERRRVQVGVVELERMLLHRMEVDSDAEDDEDEEDSSDASSDLFDLENFAGAPDAAAAAAYRDELPVYETTRVVLNRAIGHGHGYTHGRSTRVV
ncbi:hypothetical protein U9M48_006298 [Paspalum notatum var. saurae]|uniref:Protein BIG GRAIN 1 n=1 Tax=Paspalum notatum var. saurae TaxID=547442 RepID=A0AAQ3SLQ2_PASNO